MKKIVKNKDMQFCMWELEIKIKRIKKFWPERGFQPQIFGQNFPAQNLNF